MEVIRTKCTETYVTSNSVSVTVTEWGNLEGASIMVHDNALNLRMAGAFRWEEIDAVVAALTAARVQ